ncbi:MAG: nucleoside hydrolase [Anaerolineales bacterium]|nr:nucleoside hydrolase [Anaerolineales bacterium]
MKQKIILDVDTGFDDAVALLLAGHHPALELAAVTVCHGNAPLAVTVENTRRVLAAGGLGHVPVYAGAERALVAPPLKTDPLQHHRFDLPPAARPLERQRAAEFLIDYYLSPAGPETVLVPLAPQTNLALALRLEPRLAERCPRLVTMAGAYLEGNSTPSAEFNILADPEAAHIVFTAGWPLTMVGLEVTAQAYVTPADLARLRALGTPWAALAADIFEPHLRWWQTEMNWPGGQIYDACAVAAVVDPALLTTKPMHVDIELGGAFTRGRTVADAIGWHRQPANVDVGVGLDRERFLAVLLAGLQ